MKTRHLGIAISFAIALLTSIPPAFATETLPPQIITPEMRCRVCGMYPSRYPKWMAEIVFKDKVLRAFDSPSELFLFMQNMLKYETHHNAKDISSIYFTDYEKGGWIESQTTFFVSGSNAKGPMDAADLPAFSSKEAADRFAKGNGGTVLAFDKVTPEVINALSSAHDQKHAH